MTHNNAQLIALIGREAIFEWITQAYTVTSIAQTIGVPFLVLSKWLNAPEQAEEYALSKKYSAQVLQDEALGIADEQAEPGYKATSASVQAAKLRSDIRMRQAAQRDRTLAERYTPPDERQVQQLPQSVTFVINGITPKHAQMTQREITKGITIDG